MADFVVKQGEAVTHAMKTRWKDMGDGTHAQVVSAVLVGDISVEGGEAPQLLKTDSLTGALTTIDVAHHEVHDGDTFVVSRKPADASPVADNGTLIVLLGPSTKYAHLSFDCACGGEGEVELLEDPNILVAGTALTPRNLDRSSSTTPTVSCSYGATISAGTVLVNFMMPGGTSPQGRSGGTVRNNTEWILQKGHVYGIRLTNRSGGNQQVSIVAQWYEA